ncbi:hypothetical protein Leryth_005156 [Lithospermum erythrorhizon]|nr:hypothetical protein Leryth_005156 [Lithospermum erythrorhizon]
MEVIKITTLITVTIFLGLLIGHGKSSDTFKDCYGKCFIFCMIDPAQSLCNCTTSCLKQCIFSGITPQSHHEHSSNNLNFCKLGCAFSMCSGVSSKHQPYADKVDNCVGSCSKTCIKNYLSP